MTAAWQLCSQLLGQPWLHDFCDMGFHEALQVITQLPALTP